MFSRLLIANRGEIACRVIHTCRRLGVHTIAVFSEADAGARHVRLADEAVAIGGAAPQSSYLDVGAVMAAAKARRADAVHPGYGFLSENPALAEACREARIAFVGPAPATIEAMGSKRRARRLMAEAGVPVVPGYDEEDQSDETLATAAESIGFPVMIKASAGGGGKGMRIVRKAADFAAALAGARREARAAFGDDRMILERYLERPRHVEFQVFGDSHGNVVHLFERECSIQRRYQKIIEETPSPVLDAGTRARMAEAAVAAARAVDYVNAGTVEFLLGEGGEFYFMEMNTRLQVEHPVTEAVTGRDLVEWQLRVAAGEPLPADQDGIRRRGHAIEARIYAENPFNDFLPSTGRVGRFLHPPAGLEARLDTGIEDGDEVSIHYDPMVAKLIVWGADRDAAVARLREALARTVLTGPSTNLPLLRAIAGHPDFAAGKMDTGYLDRELGTLLGEMPEAHEVALVAAACAVLMAPRPAAAPGGDRHSPWDRADGWRLSGGGVRLAFEDAAGTRYVLTLRGWDGEYEALVGGERRPVRAFRLDEDHLEIRYGDAEYLATVLAEGERYYVGLDLGGYELVRRPLYAPEGAAGEADTHPTAPMPGRVVALHVAPGDTVEPGQPLLVLEGMKMEYTLTAPVAGTIARIACAEGDMVEADAPLVDIDPAGEGS